MHIIHERCFFLPEYQSQKSGVHIIQEYVLYMTNYGTFISFNDNFSKNNKI